MTKRNETEAATTTTIYWDTQDPHSPGWAYRQGSESGPIDDLDDLLAVLRDAGDVVEVRGMDEAHPGGMDALPSFGGTMPDDTSTVWSWDETRLLVGSCPDEYELVARAHQGAQP